MAATDKSRALSGYTDLRCRMYGHAWNPLVERPDEARGFFLTKLGCLRCGTERQDLTNAHGYLADRHYVYADDYLLPKGVRVTRAEFRAKFQNIQRGRK